MTDYNYTFNISKTPDLLSEEDYQVYIGEITKRKEYIHDINITCNMEPFDMDAHGVVLDSSETAHHLEQMLRVQKDTGIKISLVFNNIYVPNDFLHMEIFIKNFQKYYDRGVRNVTLPHILWMKNGSIKKVFPELYVKSTVLRRVRTAQEFWNYAEAGFDCVNVDRLMFRNQDGLLRIKEAQRKFYKMYGRYVDISMVVDENCLGNCPFWEEHYQHTMTSQLCREKSSNVEGFLVVPGYSDCKTITPLSLQRINFVCFYDELEKVFSYLDIVKFGGRRFFVDVFKHMDFLTKKKDLTCHPMLNEILVRNNVEEVEMLITWKERTRNCFYQCWDCNLCKDVNDIILKNKLKSWKKILT